MPDDFQPLPPRATPTADADLAPTDRYAEVSFRKKTADSSLISLIVMIIVWMLVGMLALLVIDLWKKSAERLRNPSTGGKVLVAFP
jgi:hypothetical protein